MSDKSENCPVCLKEMKEHTVLDMVNCRHKSTENKDDSNPTSFDKNQEALKLINGLLESPDTFVFRSVMVTPEVSLLDILEKLKKTLT